MKKTPTTRAGARLWNRMADKYSKKPVADQQAYETKLAKTDQLLKASDYVLEIGCGTGTTAIHHAPKVNHVVAIDYSKRMIEIAQQKARTAELSNLDFRVTSVSDYQSDLARFDVVLAHSILHLVPDVPSTLTKINELLKPGGVVVTTTPCIGDFFKAFKYINAFGKTLGLMPFVGVFNESQLNQWMHDADFEIEERWLPAPKAGLFLIGRKPRRETS